MIITLGLLENTVKMAKYTGKTENFSAKINNKERDFSIFVSYHPDKDAAKDIYPYWTIDMREEEYCKTIYLAGKNLHEVRDIYNGFVNQGNESFLEKSQLIN